MLVEFIYHFNGSLYETGAFELQQLLENQYRVAVSGQGWVQYKQLVITDGTYTCPLGKIAINIERSACYSRVAVPEGFCPEKAVLDVRRTNDAEETL